MFAAAVQNYEVKVLHIDPAGFSDKPVTVASGDLDMAQYVTATGTKRPVNLNLALRDNPAWSSLSGDVLLKMTVECGGSQVGLQFRGRLHS